MNHKEYAGLIGVKSSRYIQVLNALSFRNLVSVLYGMTGAERQIVIARSGGICPNEARIMIAIHIIEGWPARLIYNSLFDILRSEKHYTFNGVTATASINLFFRNQKLYFNGVKCH